MSPPLLPVVRLLLPCEAVVYDLALEAYVLTSPVHVVLSDPGGTFPIAAPTFWCYLQLTDAIGTFRFSVAVLYEGSDRVVARTPSAELTFSKRARIGVVEAAIGVTGVRFPRPGLYPLVVMCNEVPLDSGGVVLRVLEASTR